MQSQSTTSSHNDKLVKFLIRELDGASNVKKFSSDLKALGICDLSKSQTQEFIMSSDGSPMLFTLVSYYNFGILNKIVQIQKAVIES